LVIIEDQYLVRDALARLIDKETDIEVVGTAEDGQTGLALIEQERPDVALIDIELPVLDGLAVVEAMASDGLRTRAAILTTFGRPGYLERALAAGAVGFLLKEQPVSVLVEQVRRLAQGERIIDGQLAAAAMVAGPNPLSSREQDILRRIAAGETIGTIARALYLTHGTVRNYLSSAMQKLDADNRMGAVREAERRGWI
jgi:two-component system response regulator DesR